jgi:hypothetical protein
MSVLQLRVARRRLKSFADESKLIDGHRQAMERLDCEAFLQLGIDAYDWLVRADQAIRKAMLAGGEEHSPRTEQALENLFRAWLEPCKLANKWITSIGKRGQSPENLARFRECETEVRAIVRFLDDDMMTDAMRAMRDEAISEHESGQTAEMVA